MKKWILASIILSMLAASAYSQVCSPTTVISMPFTKDGAGQFCYEATCIGTPINSWNLAQLTINGVDFTNKWADASTLPAPVNGKYYIVYNGAYAWSHFEATGTCGAAPTAVPTSIPTAVPTSVPTIGPGNYVLNVSAPNSMWNQNTSITVSGDYSGTILTPFSIGPYTTPFTVTLAAPATGYSGGVFAQWMVNTIPQTMFQNVITVSVNTPGTPATAVAYYMEASNTAVPTPIPTPVSTPTQIPQTVVINSIAPVSGVVGTTVTITGSGFGTVGDTIAFTKIGYNPENGELLSAVSADGTTLKYVIPNSMCPFCRYQSNPPCGAPCLEINAGILLGTITDGLFNIYVKSPGGTSNSVVFTVIAQGTPVPTPETGTPVPTPETTTPIPTPIVGTPTTTPVATIIPLNTPEVTPIAQQTPTPTPTILPPVSDPAPGMVWFGSSASPYSTTVLNGSNFITSVSTCTGSQILAAYGIDISFNAAVIAVNTAIGTSGVEPASSGFVSAVNAATPGIIRISGFDANGKGPSTYLPILNINWTAIGAGSSVLDMTVNTLIDPTTATIGIVAAIDGNVIVN